MKKLLSTLSVLTLILFSPTQFDLGMAYASDLALEGSVPLDMQISFTPSGNTNIHLRSPDSQPVGSINYKSNSTTGFRISFASLHAGRMKREGAIGNSDEVSYALSAADFGPIVENPNWGTVTAPISVFGGIDITVSSGVPIIDSKNLTFESSQQLDVPGISAPSELTAGVYSDVVTATITVL
jgi:hypothetical protein